MFQIRDEDAVVGGESLTLPQLQHLMSEEYGETHFNAFEQPILYAQVSCYYCFILAVGLFGNLASPFTVDDIDQFEIILVSSSDS